MIRGGTNEVHGAIYEYLENRNLNALDQAAKRQGTFTQPALRPEPSRRRASAVRSARTSCSTTACTSTIPPGQASVPSSAVYAPTAAGYATLATLPGVSQTNLGILKQYRARPPTRRSKTTSGRRASPSRSASCRSSRRTSPTSTPGWCPWTTTCRTRTSSASATWTTRRRRSTPTASPAGVLLPRPTTAHLASVSEFHNFSPNLTNEFRLAYNRYNDNIGIPELPVSRAWTCFRTSRWRPI